MAIYCQYKTSRNSNCKNCVKGTPSYIASQRMEVEIAANLQVAEYIGY